MKAPRLGLATRLAATFAAVAVGTAAAVAIAAPPIVGRGFAMMMNGATMAPGMGQGHGNGMGGGMGQGMGAGAGAGYGAYAAQLQQEATVTIVLVALAAAIVASLLGVVISRRIARPLVRLESAAASVAGGNLTARSGLAGRTDEIGSLGRSFDAMAEDLEQNEAARRRFFADAAHEMKTPLAVIEATAAAVMDGVYDHDPRHLATIREQARLLGRVVDDLRTVSLAEAGALPLQLASVRAADVVRAVAETFRVRAEAAGVVLATDADPAEGAAVLHADRDRLAQALGTFVDNALRYVPAGGSIVLRVSPAPAASVSPASAGPRPMVRLAVLDTGPGVAEAHLPHVYDRFYQADAARDRGTGTSGLGLSIAKAIAEAHGGSAGVANRPEGGAAFWLDLPAAG